MCKFVLKHSVCMYPVVNIQILNDNLFFFIKIKIECMAVENRNRSLIMNEYGTRRQTYDSNPFWLNSLCPVRGSSDPFRRVHIYMYDNYIIGDGHTTAYTARAHMACTQHNTIVYRIYDWQRTMRGRIMLWGFYFFGTSAQLWLLLATGPRGVVTTVSAHTLFDDYLYTFPM